MHTSELLKHIYDINLSYLLLAQRLIVQDKASANVVAISSFMPRRK
ncbi:flagellar transcriptional regulator FlhD, partial [Escherichia sp. HC-CC]